jgi:hypothetical protein
MAMKHTKWLKNIPFGHKNTNNTVYFKALPKKQLRIFVLKVYVPSGNPACGANSYDSCIYNYNTGVTLSRLESST